MAQPRNSYFMVDVEASGPVPGLYNMVSLAATVIAPDDEGALQVGETLYLELRPVFAGHDPAANAIHGLDIERLAQEGLEPHTAMMRLTEFVEEHTLPGSEATFAAHVAVFDWMYVCWYYAWCGLENPFGTDLDRLVEDLALTASVLAAQTFDLGAAPESGGPALLAAAEDRVSKTRSRLQTLESDQNEAEADLERLERAAEPLTGEDEARRDEAAQRVAQLRRRILAARARLTEAETELAALIEAGTGTAGNGA